ncbi:MAG TPA: DUF1565 domain-containing protein [Acidiferrobacterales bacterium]|nr:DUF1565 domain-containing protein [Acidiferrobacterales bacterium]
MKHKRSAGVALIKSGAVRGYLLSSLFLLTVAITASCGSSGYGGGGGGGYGAPQPMQGASFYVDEVKGFDSLYYGTSSAPFRTITYALLIAGPNTTIIVQPGTYNSANTEMFPLVLQPGQMLIGDVPNKGDNGTTSTIITGTGSLMTTVGVFTSATIVGASGSRVSGFKIENAPTALDVAIVASGAMEISNNTLMNTNGVVVFADSGTVSAMGNTWPQMPPVCGTDIVVSPPGIVIWGSMAMQQCPP